MIQLKPYQNRVLESLRDFLRRCSSGMALHTAFYEIHTGNGFPSSPYLPIMAAGMGAEMPYVCLRVPTGGGKTLIACHAVGVAKQDLLRGEHAIVLWLVAAASSKTVVTQTADALRDPRHPYRRALETACAGAVEVLTIEEALGLTHAVADGATVVIVSTIDAFRAQDTTGRRVFMQNGGLAEHFLNVSPDRVTDLLPGPDGKPIPSLVNVLRLRRPVVIVDEAHNARSELSFGTLGAVMPSCIIELTATPARKGVPSNVLHYVSAAELKAAEMVKLPLRVVTRVSSQKDQLLADALTTRSDLERIAIAEGQETGEYLRPILLIQALRVDDCEDLRDRLVQDFGISRDEVVISIGKLDELPSEEVIASRKCKVRVIITVQKLREGWNCPFAYVLCSLRETRSVTAIEQIVGRILRLPGAKLKCHPDLNCSYVFSVSEGNAGESGIHAVLAELKGALESNGFTAAEAERLILPVTPGTLPLGVQPQTVTLEPGNEMDTAAAAAQVALLGGKVRLNTDTGALTIFVPLDRDEEEALTGCAATPAGKAKISAAVQMVRDVEKAFGTGQPRMPSPYELGIDFTVPLLCVREDGDLFVFESTFLLEQPWKLGAKDASLADRYNPLKRPGVRSGTVDVGTGNKIATSAQETEREDFVGKLHHQVMQLAGSSDWTDEMLIGWIDRRIDHRDIPVGESAAFLRKVLNGLKAKHGIEDASVLALDRYRLREEVEKAIQGHREKERNAAFKHWLLPESALTVDESCSINFAKMGYEPSWLCEGGFQFRKHYFGSKPGELEEKRADGKEREEFQCAQYLDGLAEIRFWARNLSKRSSSFRLQTATDWFYPDFICLLTDGRVLAVEYKGGNAITNDDSRDKMAVGAVWESRSGGKCLFVMPTNGDFSAIKKKITG